jgi:hypothetical protein
LKANQPHGSSTPAHSLPLRRMAAILNRYFALLVLLSYVLLHTLYHRVPADSASPSWSGENYHIAASIVQGKGFANPFPHLESGASAWVAPPLPYLLAGVFWLVGTKTPAAAWLAIFLQSLLFAGTLWLLYLIVQRTFSANCAKAATLIWLISPNRIGLTSIYFVSEVGFSTFGVLLAIVMLIRFKDNPTTKGAALAGLAIGFAILCLPVMVLALPLYACALYVRASVRPARAWVAPILACALSVGVLAPWLVRNYIVFREFVFIKSNIGVALYVANSKIGYYDFPSEAEQGLLRRMGEIPYNRYSRQRALAWIRGHRKEFLARCLTRTLAFWVANPVKGLKRTIWNLYQIPFLAISALGVWRHWHRSPVTAFCIAILIVVPGVYYLTSFGDQQRYRLPFEALLTIFASAVLIPSLPRNRELRSTTLASI